MRDTYRYIGAIGYREGRTDKGYHVPAGHPCSAKGEVLRMVSEQRRSISAPEPLSKARGQASNGSSLSESQFLLCVSQHSPNYSSILISKNFMSI